MKPTNYEISKLSMKILYTGLLIDVLGAVLVFFGGMYLVDNVLQKVTASEGLHIFGMALIAVSVAELVVIFVLKRNFFKPENLKRANHRTFKKFAAQINIYFLILFNVAFAPAIYGFLYYYLGGTQDLFVLMVCFTVIGYMLIRPKPSFIEKLVEPFEFDEV